MADVVIEASNLGKTFPGGTVAVRGLDLRIRRGTVYGLMGRNGAGKTTALRLLLGLLRPDEGEARVLGWDLREAPRQWRGRVAYVSQNQQLYGWMTLSELCRYMARFYDSWDDAYAGHLARRWGLSGGRAIASFSGGEQRKAAILLALASRPEVLFLDEPVAGLDPIARREFVQEMLDVLGESDGCTVLFSTHLIGDLERLAEQIGMMDAGQLKISGRIEDIQNTTKRVQVVFDADEPPEGFRIPGAVWMRTSGPVVTAVVRLAHPAQLDAIRHMPGVRVQVFPLGLEDIFIELFGPNLPAERMEHLEAPSAPVFSTNNLGNSP